MVGFSYLSVKPLLCAFILACNFLQLLWV